MAYDYEAEQRAFELKNRYSSPAKISMMDVHGALGRLLHAVQEDMPAGCVVELRYNRDTYLEVVVECTKRTIQTVVDRLTHGVVWGHYDFRFRLVGRPIGDFDEFERLYVTALVDLSHVEKNLRNDPR